MRRFLALCMTLTLQGQVWQDPHTLLMFNNASQQTQLYTWRGDRLEINSGPQQLEDIRACDHTGGFTYLVGTPHHPVYLQREIQESRSPTFNGILRFQQPLPSELWRSPDLRTWTKVGQWHRHPQGQPKALFPLGNGTYLAVGDLFCDGKAISPFAAYGKEAQGEFRFLRLLDPGFGEPLYPEGNLDPRNVQWTRFRRAYVTKNFSELGRGNWEVHRTAKALVAVHLSSGWLLRLDPWDGKVLARLHPYPGRALHSLLGDQGPLALGAHAEADGSLLLACRQPELLGRGNWAWHPSGFYLPSPPEGASSKLAYQLLHYLGRQRNAQDRPAIAGWPEIRWFRMVPGQDQLTPIPPPTGAPTRLEGFREEYWLTFRVRPNGTVTRLGLQDLGGMRFTLQRQPLWP